MKTSLIRTKTEDKLVLDGLLYEPDTPTDKILIAIHGMGGNFYINYFVKIQADILTQNNWALLSINNRGHDLMSESEKEGEPEGIKKTGNFNENFEDCLIDIKAAVDYAQSLGFEEIVLQGHSLGSPKVAFYVLKTKDTRVKKLILASPADMVGLSKKWVHHEEMLKEARDLVAQGKGEQILSKNLDDWYQLTAKTYLSLEEDSEVDIFNTYDPGKESVLNDLNIPTLCFFADKEYVALYGAKKSLEIIKAKAKNCSQFDTAILPGESHVYLEHEQDMADLVLNWLQK